MAYANIKIKDSGEIKIKLTPENAPISVENFTELAKSGFYDGLTFHRVISGFMVQGGDPTGTGMGDSKKKIKGEFKKNGVDNTLSHKRGVLSMARSSDPNSASCQFFICHDDATFLDGEYAAFGVTELGIEEVDKIAKVATDRNDKPKTPVIIEKIYITE